MAGEKDLNLLLKNIKPEIHQGEYVFCTVTDLGSIKPEDIISMFREGEGYSLILSKEIAVEHKLEFAFTASWITLTVHSSLEAVGLTAAFSNALSLEGISCNVVAAFYHDHIFVNKKDADKAMEILIRLSAQPN